MPIDHAALKVAKVACLVLPLACSLAFAAGRWTAPDPTPDPSFAMLDAWRASARPVPLRDVVWEIRPAYKGRWICQLNEGKWMPDKTWNAIVGAAEFGDTPREAVVGAIKAWDAHVANLKSMRN